MPTGVEEILGLIAAAIEAGAMVSPFSGGGGTGPVALSPDADGTHSGAVPLSQVDNVVHCDPVYLIAEPSASTSATDDVVSVGASGEPTPPTTGENTRPIVDSKKPRRWYYNSPDILIKGEVPKTDDPAAGDDPLPHQQETSPSPTLSSNSDEPENTTFSHPQGTSCDATIAPPPAHSPKTTWNPGPSDYTFQEILRCWGDPLCRNWVQHGDDREELLRAQKQWTDMGLYMMTWQTLAPFVALSGIGAAELVGGGTAGLLLDAAIYSSAEVGTYAAVRELPGVDLPPVSKDDIRQAAFQAVLQMYIGMLLQSSVQPLSNQGTQYLHSGVGPKPTHPLGKPYKLKLTEVEIVQVGKGIKARVPMGQKITPSTEKFLLDVRSTYVRISRRLKRQYPKPEDKSIRCTMAHDRLQRVIAQRYPNRKIYIEVYTGIGETRIDIVDLTNKNILMIELKNAKTSMRPEQSAAFEIIEASLNFQGGKVPIIVYVFAE